MGILRLARSQPTAACQMGTVQCLRNRRRIVRGDFTPAVVSYTIVVVGSLILAFVFVGLCSAYGMGAVTTRVIDHFHFIRA